MMEMNPFQTVLKYKQKKAYYTMYVEVIWEFVGNSKLKTGRAKK